MALTLEQFVSVVKESRLVSHASLAASLRQLSGEAGEPDPSKLADDLVARGELTTWQADKLLGGIHQGFFLGKHKLLRLLASGSMSAVYEAEHVLMQRRVALKILPRSLVGEASFLERFYREARAVARLNHPNIIKGFDVGQDGDTHYFVMEFVQGSTLQNLVEASGPLPIEDAVEMIRQAALGLEHAHQAGLVHRDVKPANLLRDLEGTVKILDLGLVRSQPNENDADAGLTRLHDEAVLGTVDYLSPEQAIDSHTVDIRSDVYSLGCTFYFLLTGAPPFAVGTLTERLMAHQSRSPTPLAMLRRDTPDSLSPIVDRMLAKRPQDRYQSPGEVANVLHDWLSTRASSSAIRGAPVSLSISAATPEARETRPEAAVDPEKAPSPSPAPTPSLSLSESWVRWTKVVESIGLGAFGPKVDETFYKRIYEDLLLVCRVSFPDADEPTRRTLRRIEDLVAPWPTLRSLRSILQSEMSETILLRLQEIDRVVRIRSRGNLWRRFLRKVFAP
jgi:eukaryotic-like serine/threonine-protein kinase